MPLIKTNARSASALDATVLTGNLPAISGASLTGISAGISEVDRWKLSDGNYGNNDVLTAWTRHSTLSGVAHGTGLSHSSGIFTFPSTGVYFISFDANLFSGGGTTRAYVGINMKGSNDGFSSNAQTLMISYGNTSTGGDHDDFFISGIYDVTNTSNNKLQFVVASSGSCGFYNGAITIMKLMDT